MNLPNWQDICRINESLGHTHENIRIELSCGLTISGRISCEQAKAIFREPDDMTPIARNVRSGPVVVVLPQSAVLSVTFPCDD